MDVIVCGADRCGKTTLTKRLASELKMKRLHFTCPKENLGEEDHVLIPEIPIFEQISRFVCRFKHESLLFDRFIYSDIVYGPIYRKPDMMVFRQTERVFSELQMQARNAIFIYACVEDAEKNFQMIEEEAEGVLDRKLFAEVRDAYDQIYSAVKTVFPTFRYDWTQNSYDAVLKFIQNNEMNLRHSQLCKFCHGDLMDSYIGPTIRVPTKIYKIFPRTAGITYADYIDLCIQNPEIRGDSSIGILNARMPNADKLENILLNF